MDDLSSSSVSVFHVYADVCIKALVSFDSIFTSLLLHDLYKRICRFEQVVAEWKKMLMKSGILCLLSAAKDISLTLYDEMKSTFYTQVCDQEPK